MLHLGCQIPVTKVISLSGTNQLNTVLLPKIPQIPVQDLTVQVRLGHVESKGGEGEKPGQQERAAF